MLCVNVYRSFVAVFLSLFSLFRLQKHTKVFGGGGAIFAENFDELNYFDAAKWSASSGVRVRLR